MGEEIQNLIDKIREEGVKAAEGEAKAIEGEAKKLADNIIEDARRKAGDIVKKAREEAKKTEESGYASLRQAGRDLMISLRKEIQSVLSKITAARIKEALTAAEMAKIINTIIREGSKSPKGDIVISVNTKDIEKLENSLMAELSGEIRRGVTLKRSDDITGGFTISYDSGKSYYDFTDRALAAHINFRMSQKLKKLLTKEES